MLLLLLLLFSGLVTRGLSCPQLPTGCICINNMGKLTVQCSMVPLAEVTAALSAGGASASVEVLIMEQANDTTLEKNFAQYYYPSLSILRLRFGMLQTIEPGAFTNASQLSTLDLRGNSLTVLSGAMLDGIPPGLNQLSLDQNSLQYLLSDLEPLFTSITGSISLAGNPLVCSCHIQWLVDLLHSTNTTLPSVTANCMESGSSIPQQLIDPALNLSYCPDLCTNEVYTCPLNLSCMRKQENESYFCAASPTVSLSSSHTLEIVSTTNNYYVTSSHAPSTLPPTLLSPSPTLASLSPTLLSPSPSPPPLLSITALQTLLTNAQSGGSGQQVMFIEQLHNVVSSGDVMVNEIPALVDLIASATQLVISNPNATNVETILTTVSDFLDLSQLTEISEPSATILDLFQIVDSLGKVIPIVGSSITISTPNIALLVAIPSPNSTSWNISSNLLLEDQGGETAVHIPASIIEDALRGQSASGCDVRLLASLWAVNTTLLEVDTREPPIVLANGVCDWSLPSQQMNSSVEVNSILVSISLVHSPNCSLNTSNFTEPILITLHQINSSYTQPSCGVLDEMVESGREWMRSACTLVSDEANYTVCACNHLTTFGLLMNPTGVVTSSVPLQIATKVGLSISILCLLATIFLLFALKLESKLHHIHRQLALALCLLQVLFLVGVDRRAVPTPDALCTLIAALVHYLLLCTFAWQLVEGVHVYLYIVRVFYNEKIVWGYYPFAWGTPLIIVAITLGVRFCDYGSLNYCWITQGNGANWAFHGPVIAVVTINIILLVMVMVTIIRAVHNKDPQRCFFCTLLQASIVLLPCLGINWVLGFLVVLSDDPLYREIVEYIVLVFVTLQGLAIFLVHCVLNTEVRTAFFKAFGCRETAMKQKSLFTYKTNSAVLRGWKRRVSSSFQGRRSSLESVSNDNNLPLSMRESKSYTVQLNTVLEDIDDEIFAVRSASTPNLTSKDYDTVNQS